MQHILQDKLVPRWSTRQPDFSVARKVESIELSVCESETEAGEKIKVGEDLVLYFRGE